MEANVKTKKRHYCTICSNYRGKVANGKVIKLHRFPSEPRLLRVWQKRLRLVRNDFKYNEFIRLCSEHFKNGEYTKENPVPCVFANREFQTSTLDDEENLPAATSTNTDHGDADSDHDDQENFRAGDISYLETSVFMHDYSGRVNFSVSKTVDKCQQTVTDTNTVDTSTQTTPAEFESTSSQTDFVHISTEPTVKNSEEKPILEHASIGIQVQRPDIAFEDIAHSDDRVMFYTGLPNAGVFHALFAEMGDASIRTQRSVKGSAKEGGRPRALEVFEEFFLVLMRLRLGLLLQDLAQRFHISKSTCGIVVDRWIDYLHVKLAFLTPWPSRKIINDTMPTKFRLKCADCRVIIDCTELYTETPQSLVNKSLMYSNYKSHSTFKALLGISPSGVITFASSLYAGSVSDKQMTKECGLLDLCEPGDMIMADKGFLISDLTTPRGIKLYLPPFKSKNKKFSRREIEATRRIANLRIDVERAMERVKNFRILHGVIPITLAKKVSKIWQICVDLSNLQPPLVHNVE